MLIEIGVADNKIHVKAPFALKDHCKAVTGARWSKARRVWEYPASPAVARELLNAFYRKSDIRFEQDEGFLGLLSKALTNDESQEIKTAVDLPMPPSKTDSWLHQKQAFWFAEKLPAALLGMDMGTGKSKVAVDLTNHWDAKIAFISPPMSVCPVWQREFRRHSLNDYEVLTLDDRNMGVKKKVLLAEKHIDVSLAKGRRPVIVVNHESFWREPFATFTMRTAPDFLGVDECHRAKDPKGKFSGFLTRLAPHCEHVLGLTGTLMPHSPLDVFAQYRFLDTGIFGYSFNRFRMRYAVMGGFECREVVGWQNQEDLHDKIHSIAFFVTKGEALDLPEEITSPRYCELEPKAAKAYKALETDFYAQVDDGEITVTNALVKMLRLQQLTSGFMKLDRTDDILPISTAKSGLLHDLLEETPGPIVVYARFVHDLEIISEATTALELTYHEVSGRARDLTPDATMRPDTDVLGVQIQAGSLGIDLTRASTALYYSPGNNRGDFEQSKARLHREPQINKVTFIPLIVKGTLDEAIYYSFERGLNLVQTVLNWRTLRGQIDG